MNNYYDKYIADAAREYVESLKQHELKSNDITTKSLQQKLVKLRWMVLAEQNSWNPQVFSYDPND